MNDPHVETLFYCIEKGEGIKFKEGISPVTVTTDAYTISMDASEAVVTMTAHFASVDEARALVEPFFEKWEFWDDLHERNGFRFRFKNPHVIDRNPPPEGGPVIGAATSIAATASMSAAVEVLRTRLPEPPREIELSPDAQTLRDRWLGYNNRREPLLSAANFALTVVEDLADAAQTIRRNKRQKAALYYNIEYAVLDKLGNLSGNKGGIGARKAKGRHHPLSGPEQMWVEEAFRALVIRVAEQAHLNAPPPRQLTMADLPTL